MELINLAIRVCIAGVGLATVPFVNLNTPAGVFFAVVAGLVAAVVGEQVFNYYRGGAHENKS